MTAAPILTVKMTAEQYFQLGEDPVGVRLELIDGEIIVSPSFNPEHSHVDSILRQTILNHIRPHDLGLLFGDTDVVWDAQTVRRPDMSFYAKAHLHLVSKRRLKAPPDLCIEILSPSNAADDRINKFNLYQSHGVSHYWIIDPEARTAECFTLINGAFQLTASGRGNESVHFPPFADLSIPLADLWMSGS